MIILEITWELSGKKLYKGNKSWLNPWFRIVLEITWELSGKKVYKGNKSWPNPWFRIVLEITWELSGKKYTKDYQVKKYTKGINLGLTLDLG